MKRSNLFILGVVLLTVVMISCHKGRNKLVDTWKITAVEAKMPLSDSAKNVMLTKGTLTFTEDGHVSGYMQSEINNGTYALTKGGKSLVIKDETGTPYPAASTITADKLILDMKEMKITLDKK
jgi:heat shock protein HslJ